MTHNEIKKTISKLTPGQQKTLSFIAIGMDLVATRKALEVFLKKGLIEERITTAYDSIGVKFKRYYMPLNVHLAWCEWCAQNYKGDEQEEEQ